METKVWCTLQSDFALIITVFCRAKEEQTTETHTYYDVVAEGHFHGTNKGVDQLYAEIAAPPTTAEERKEDFSMNECAAYEPISVRVAKEGEVDQSEQYESVAL